MSALNIVGSDARVQDALTLGIFLCTVHNGSRPTGHCSTLVMRICVSRSLNPHCKINYFTVASLLAALILRRSSSLTTRHTSRAQVQIDCPAVRACGKHAVRAGQACAVQCAFIHPSLPTPPRAHVPRVHRSVAACTTPDAYLR